MPKFQFDVSLDLSFNFEIEAETEDAAFGELWNTIGYDGEDLVDMTIEVMEAIDSENFDIRVREVTDGQ